MDRRYETARAMMNDVPHGEETAKVHYDHGAIGGNLNLCHETTENLEKVIRALEERLSVSLGHGSPELGSTKDSAPTPVESPLAGMLRDHNKALHRLIGIVKDITARVEL
jgi:hypothetical protein